MNERILNDFFSKQTGQQERMVKAIEAMALATQQKESEKTPTIVRPTTINLTCGTTAGQINSIQLVRRDPHRKSVAIYNFGSGDLLWACYNFDPATILSQFSDPNHPDVVLPVPNQAVQIGFLPTGGSTSFDGTEAIWGYNVATNCVLTLTETLFTTPHHIRSATFPVPGLDGALGAGYEVAPGVDGNPVVVKGIR